MNFTAATIIPCQHHTMKPLRVLPVAFVLALMFVSVLCYPSQPQRQSKSKATGKTIGGWINSMVGWFPPQGVAAIPTSDFESQEFFSDEEEGEADEAMATSEADFSETESSEEEASAINDSQ